MPFDPATLPQLRSLGQRLQQLAGDAAYKAGRDYLRKGHVKDGSVAPSGAEPAAFALVAGSTDYRVSVRLPAADEASVTCTCPAHRRSKFCKHVVAVCAALLEQPAAFSVLESLPDPPAPAARKKGARAGGPAKAKAEPSAQRAAGLDVLDRLLLELTEGGLMSLGAEKSQLIAQCAELVRALKLRRLGNLLMQLQRAVADPQRVDSTSFTRLLLDLYRCRTATGAMLDGSVALDPRLAEDLLGKTWRAEELEPISGLELIQVATTQESDGEFLIATSYLADLASLTIYLDRVIAPRRLRGTDPPNHRLRLLVDSAGLFPGLAPRRIRLGQYARAALWSEHLDRLIEGAVADIAEIQRQLIEQAAAPFGPPEAAILFRPSELLTAPEGVSGLNTRAGAPAGALDASGQFLALDWSTLAAAGLEAAPPPDEPYALFGLATMTSHGLQLRPLSVVGVTPRSTGRSSYGRIFPA